MTPPYHHTSTQSQCGGDYETQVEYVTRTDNDFPEINGKRSTKEKKVGPFVGRITKLMLTPDHYDEICYANGDHLLTGPPLTGNSIPDELPSSVKKPKPIQKSTCEYSFACGGICSNPKCQHLHGVDKNGKPIGWFQ